MTALGRRSRIDVYLPEGWPFRTILQHDVFLDIGRELRPGDRVEVSVSDAVCSGLREGGFAFEPDATVSRSIQANQAGYLPDAPIVWGVGAYSVHIRPVLVAWFATGDRTYRDWIVRSCDNTLGANPMGLSWIVGLGERTIRAPLHNSRYRPAGVVADGMQSEGPSARAGGYNYNETVYPEHRDDFAPLHEYADCHFAIAMDEGVVRNQVLAMAIFGTLLP